MPGTRVPHRDVCVRSVWHPCSVSGAGVLPSGDEQKNPLIPADSQKPLWPGLVSLTCRSSWVLGVTLPHAGAVVNGDTS